MSLAVTQVFSLGDPRAALTDAARAVLVGVVPSAAAQRVPLARVGPHRVDAVESWLAGLRERCALIDIW